MTGEVKRGQVPSADRAHLRARLARFAGRDDVAFALERCTGWRYVAGVLAAAGVSPHVAEPADTALRLRPQAARQDRQDRLAAPTGAAGRGPAARVLDPAVGHPGVPGAAGDLSRASGRAQRLGAAHPRGVLPKARAPALGALRTGRDIEAVAAAALHMSTAGQLQVATATDMLACLEGHLGELRRRLLASARGLTGAWVLAARLYGVGPVKRWR